MKMKTKIQLVLLVILLLSGILITTIWSNNARTMADTYLNDISQRTMENTYDAFEYILTDTAEYATRIALNKSNIIEPVSNFNKNDYLVEGQWVQGYLDNKRTIMEYLSGGIGYQYYLSGIAIVAEERCIFSTDISLSGKDKLYEEILKLDQTALKRSVLMMDPIYLEGLTSTASNNLVIPAVRGIVDENYDIIGYVVLYFDYGVIESKFATNMPDGSYFKVLNSHGTEIYSNTSEEWDENYIRNNCVSNTFEASAVSWTFHMSIPTEYYTTRILYTSLFTGVVIFLIILVAGLISAIVVSELTGEISVLKKRLDSVASGDLETSYTVKKNDEIGQMGSAFNHMVERMRSLVSEVKEKERQKRINEMAFLQAQINPHFISNILNNVSWMAKLQHADNVVPLVQSLNALLHDVMHQEKHIIFLHKELEYVANYLIIMEYSGSYDYTVELDIEDEANYFCIPSFILQPLVENAIYYGQPDDLSKQAIIKISAHKLGDYLELIIEDNGSGITEQQQAEMLTKVKHSTSINGIGVTNVNERIQLFFGEEYGLSYESKLGHYTRCIIKLPIVLEEQ